MVNAIILAAGSSSRLGTAKQLLTFREQPLIRLVTKNVLNSHVDQVIVVVGCQSQEVAAAVSDLPVTVVFNRNYAKGQSTSLRAGLEACCTTTIDGALFALGDQPLVDSKTIDLLIKSFHLPSDIVVPYFEEIRGNPTLFGKQYFPELLALTGDSGGRDIIRHHPDQVVRVEVTDPGVCLDLDTWEDYFSLK